MNSYGTLWLNLSNRKAKDIEEGRYRRLGRRRPSSLMKIEDRGRHISPHNSVFCCPDTFHYYHTSPLAQYWLSSVLRRLLGLSLGLVPSICPWKIEVHRFCALTTCPEYRSKSLIWKTSDLNERNFLIRVIYKDWYYLTLSTASTFLFIFTL